MTLRSDLRALLRDGDADYLRWRLARVLLRWAGALLARSDAGVLNVQTSSAVAAWFYVGTKEIILDSTERRKVLTGHDAHGLLLQLAAASYRADREEVCKR